MFVSGSVYSDELLGVEDPVARGSNTRPSAFPQHAAAGGDEQVGRAGTLRRVAEDYEVACLNATVPDALDRVGPQQRAQGHGDAFAVVDARISRQRLQVAAVLGAVELVQHGSGEV